MGLRAPVLLSLALAAISAPIAIPQQIAGASVSGSSASITVDMLPAMRRAELRQTPASTGAPYSGRQVITATNALPVRQEMAVYRDSMGRVRMERDAVVTAQLPFFKLITIDDPVSGYEYMIDTVNHVAHRMALPADRPPPAPVTQNGPGPILTESSPGPGITVTTIALGKKTVSGVEVVGNKTTTTYGPESQTGKGHPVTTVREIWTAPSLGIITESRAVTPNGGERVMTIEDLKVTEPDPALFQVPAGYRVEEETSTFTIVIPR